MGGCDLPMPTDVVLCKLADFLDGTLRHFEIMGYDIAVAHAGGTLHRPAAACPYPWANPAAAHADNRRTGPLPPPATGHLRRSAKPPPQPSGSRRAGLAGRPRAASK